MSDSYFAQLKKIRLSRIDKLLLVGVGFSLTVSILFYTIALLMFSNIDSDWNTVMYTCHNATFQFYTKGNVNFGEIYVLPPRDSPCDPNVMIEFYEYEQACCISMAEFQQNVYAKYPLSGSFACYFDNACMHFALNLDNVSTDSYAGTKLAFTLLFILIVIMSIAACANIIIRRMLYDRDQTRFLLARNAANPVPQTQASPAQPTQPVQATPEALNHTLI